MKKKFAGIFLALVLVFSFNVVVFAEIEVIEPIRTSIAIDLETE